MSRWAWGAIAAVLAVGVVTLWQSYLLLSYNMSGLPAREVEPRLLALSALPTGLFLAAAVVGRRSAAIAAAAAASAVVVGLLRVLTIRYELSEPWTRSTGLASGAAWAAGLGVAVVVCLIALVSAVLSARPQDPTRSGG